MKEEEEKEEEEESEEGSSYSSQSWLHALDRNGLGFIASGGR